MVVRVPAVVLIAQTPVCDLQSLDFSNGSHLNQESLYDPIIEETIDGFCLLGQEINKVIFDLVRTRQGQQG